MKSILNKSEHPEDYLIVRGDTGDTATINVHCMMDCIDTVLGGLHDEKQRYWGPGTSEPHDPVIIGLHSGNKAYWVQLSSYLGTLKLGSRTYTISRKEPEVTGLKQLKPFRIK